MSLLAYVEMDIFGVLILLFFWHNQRRFGSLSTDDRLFNGILLIAILEQLMDAGQWMLEGAFFFGSYALQVFCYTVGHAIAPMITCLWAMYCDLRTNMDERGLKRRLPLYLFPMGLHVLLLIANLFTPLVFRIDAEHTYHRDHFFLAYMVLMYLYGMVSMLWVARKALSPSISLDRTEYRYMALFIIPPFLGGALQWMFYGLSLIWICMVLSIVMVYTNVLSRQISTDPLTGLNNRRKLNRYIDMRINSSEADRSLFLMMLDADGFKGINDTLGHAAGDRALMAIAEILKNLCQCRDCFLSRLGGDEFVILGQDHTGNDPETLAQQIYAKVDQFNEQTREPFHLSLSIGWSYFDPQQVNSADALLNTADQRMYLVKTAKHLKP
ncbi:MAG TPA: GGDEF domain-containing protein [Candidatus Limiplasma sp.]|nr:GGDEF domain-containing protein [Candidatus Limiplasma sp.]